MAGRGFLPTHVLRFVRRIMLKTNTAMDILPYVWPVGLLLLVAAKVALLR